jgi:signal transduction histidine kinase
VEVAGAQEGVLFWTAHPDLTPVVTAVLPEKGVWINKEPIGPNQPINEERHPAAARALPCAQFKGSQKPQSRLALPISIAGRCFGCIALMHREPFQFDSMRVEALRLLVEIFAFPLQFAGQDADRAMWESAFVHEMQEPPKIILDHLSLLRMRQPELGEAAEMRRALDSLQVLDGTILSLKTLMRKQPNLRLCPVAADGAVRDELRRFDFLLFRKKLTDGLAAERAVIAAQPVAFGRILYILIHNALKHGKKNSTITITSSYADKMWLLTIESTGAMSAEDARHAFDVRFVKPGGGMHIGLATALKLASAQRAVLAVENDIENDRVRARLEWPARLSRAKVAPERPAAKQPRAAKRPRRKLGDAHA